MTIKRTFDTGNCPLQKKPECPENIYFKCGISAVSRLTNIIACLMETAGDASIT